MDLTIKNRLIMCTFEAHIISKGTTLPDVKVQRNRKPPIFLNPSQLALKVVLTNRKIPKARIFEGCIRV